MKRILPLLLLWLSLPLLAQTVPQLPVEAFASIPDVSSVQLSPDGKKIASIVRVDQPKLKGTVVSILDLETGAKDVAVHTDNQKFVLLSLQWANDTTLLISAKFPANRYGTPTTETRLVKYDLTTRKTTSVLARSVVERLSWIPQHQGQIIDMMPDDPDHILLALDGMGEAVGEDSVLRVNLSQGKSAFIQNAKRKVIGWIADRQHKVRISIYNDDTEYRIYEQPEQKTESRLLWTFKAFSEDSIWPLGFDADPNILYVRAYHQGFEAIFKVNLTDPKLTKELVYANENTDVEGDLIYSELKKKVIGISEGDGEEYTFWDPEYAGLQNGLKAVLPNAHNFITQFSANERRYIVYSTSSTQPGTYYFGDRDEKALFPIAERYSQLSSEQLADTQYLSYEARDKLKIDAYLTVPKGLEAKNLPTIIFPHGGPISYDSNDFDYWAQFFANRGYAVFRMNFRGSAGYGYEFMKAGLKSWGLEMQNDVEDGTRYLINQGISDPQRICIVGASYGGYAALMGAAMTPDLYRCAVSVAGVTDVAYLVKSSRRFTNYEVVKEQIGDDFSALYERSPVSKADKITIPVLLLHGDKDRVVKVQHSREMFDELKSRKKNVEYIELENGDHYLSNNDHRLTTFKALDKFLADNLKTQL
ncbi:alpha/beta hydrolase family protein [Shewanella xiamenensis]|jgi:dipeptidyl aminopeptidase/acylaminoacyl peptidase|uniref:S9 family peptidase n=1 Tax=Shewanella xiamenensis TaxID=332186 RepID=A0AAE4Q251_9GAMM|nr:MULTISPECIES: S9 family peptidase [Shewanella]MCD8550443.1 S9 family peptidase [Shewanella xiamenensis]MCD8558816.1 S9 family peptidase [Shewanella xiamenensis]MDH1626272.1 S9 family peptidase [Shewanella xiamenensis]MDV5392505.1 S9 family peptidase [Shewanella xiamenensis]PHY61729.1 S9 family peptidase [Shewanella xiamenensis]